MDRDSAFVALDNDSPSERLEGARYLQFWAVPSDIPDLRAAIQREPVLWIRSALRSALSRLGDGSNTEVAIGADSDDDFTADEPETPLSKDNIARTLVHELGTSMAAVRYHIEEEWGDFSTSKTKKSIDRLERFLRAIGELARVSPEPEIARVDLAASVAATVESVQQEHDLLVNLEGPHSLEIYSNRGLLELILANALKNACEATMDSPNQTKSVSVFFNSNDREAWVVIFDNGVGLPPGGANNLFKIGHTSKENHIGMGLALCRQAASSLKAKIELSSDGGQTRFELQLRKGRGVS